MTHAEMQTRATRYYLKRMVRVSIGCYELGDDGLAAELFRTVQAGLSAIVPGRQKAKTQGWLKMCLAAHKAAARQLGAPRAK